MTPNEHTAELADMKLALEGIKMLIAGLDAKISDVQSGQGVIQGNMREQKDVLLSAIIRLENTGNAVVDAARALRESVEPSKKKTRQASFVSR